MKPARLVTSSALHYFLTTVLLLFTGNSFGQAELFVNSGGYYGLKNTTGKEVFPCRQRFIKEMGYGYFAYSPGGIKETGSGEKESDFTGLKFGIVDSSGKIILPPAYTRISTLSARRSFFYSLTPKDASLPEHEQQKYYVGNLKGKRLSPEGFCSPGADLLFQYYNSPPATQTVFCKEADLEKAGRQFYLFSAEGRLLAGPLNGDVIQGHPGGGISVINQQGKTNYYAGGALLNPEPLPLVAATSRACCGENKFYGIDNAHNLYRLPLRDDKPVMLKITGDILDFVAYQARGNDGGTDVELAVLQGKRGAMRPLFLSDSDNPDEIIIANRLKPEYDSLYYFTYHIPIDTTIRPDIVFALGKKGKIEYVMAGGEVMRTTDSWKPEDFFSFCSTADSVARAREEKKAMADAYAEKLKEKEERRKAPEYNFKLSNLNGVSAYALHNHWEDTLVGGFIYSEIRSCYNRYLVCKALDTALELNCKLLDQDLHELIPYGKFTEIIPSPDGRYAVVYGKKYNNRIRTLPNDTTTQIMELCDRGIYDVVNRKMIVPFGKYETFAPDAGWNYVKVITPSYFVRVAAYDTTTMERVTRSWGVYDLKNNKLTVPVSYAYIGSLADPSLIPVNTGGFDYDTSRLGQGGKYGLIDINGKEILKPAYTYIGPPNGKGFLLAQTGGSNMDGVFGGTWIAIDKSGQNIKPDYAIDPMPVVKSVRALSRFSEDEEIVYGYSAAQLNDSIAALANDSAANAVYSINVFTERTANGVYVVASYTEKSSMVELNRPLPANLHFRYWPMGPVKNWGRYEAYKSRSANPVYDGIKENNTYTAAIFHSVDSIYAGYGYSDTLQLDYTYPGVMEQNKTVLNKKFRTDIQSGRELLEILMRQGLVENTPLIPGALKYKYQAPCDSVVRTIPLGKHADDPLATINSYSKNFGLLLNGTVELPPVYKYILSAGSDEYRLVDTLNNVWIYTVSNRQLLRENTTFVKFIRRKSHQEESSDLIPVFMVLRKSNSKLALYNITTSGLFSEADSLDYVADYLNADENGNEIVVYSAIEDDSYVTDLLMIYDGGKKFIYDLFNNVRQEVIDPVVPEKYKGLTIEKIFYKNVYPYKDGNGSIIGWFYSNTNTYKFYDAAGISNNAIRIDSVYASPEHFIYYYRKKMYLATVRKKGEQVKPGQYLKANTIMVLDSAKKISVVNESVYKADAAYRKFTGDRLEKYTPPNFSALPLKTVRIKKEDTDKMMLRPEQLYLEQRNGWSYLLRMAPPEETENTYKSTQLQVVDSAKTFVFYTTEKDDAGIYKADGVIKSGRSYLPLPVQDIDTAILIANKGNSELEVFAVKKNKSWTVLVYNHAKKQQYKLLSDYTYPSFHELRKALYPSSLFNVECEGTPAKKYTLLLEELTIKSTQEQDW